MPTRDKKRNAPPDEMPVTSRQDGRDEQGHGHAPFTRDVNDRADRDEPRPQRERFASGAPMTPHAEAPDNILLTWGTRFLEGAMTFGKRLFVHLAALLCGVAVAFAEGSVLRGLCAYAGIVCILARGMTVGPSWLVPAGAGVVQTILLAFFGLPWPQALFWGGVQSWLQRLLRKRLHMGAEWGMVLVLVPIGIFLLDTMPVLLLVTSFAGVAVAAGLVGRAAAPQNPTADTAEGSPEPPRVAAYRESLGTFLTKVKALPPNVRGFGESIAISTGNILDCMAADTRDVETGHRFLNRYFNAAHSVVEKHLSLSQEQHITRELADALEKSREMLIRLDAVFAKEHGRLLANDVTDFSADLAVIDTLLKMDGR